MNKAKAIFAAGMIVIVAGASAALWYLNDSGVIGNDSTVNHVEDYDNENHENDVDNENDAQQDINNNEKEQKTEKTDVNTDEKTEIEESEINDFLSVFSKVYFAEQGKAFDIKKCSDYELILFAYSYIRSTDRSLITLEQREDNIKYYNCVSFDKINEVLNKYFDASVPAESVFTENDYAFFDYSDGFFYTPATDGLAYINTAQADSVEQDGDYITVKFTVLSDDEQYADGEAKIQIKNDELKLVYYRIYK